MTHQQKALRKLLRFDFTLDPQIFGQCLIALKALIGAVNSSKDDPRLQEALAPILVALFSLFGKAPSTKEIIVERSSEKVLENTLHRISRHIKARYQDYEKFYSVAHELAIKLKPDNYNLGDLKAALDAARDLNPRTKDPEEVHNVLRKMSGAAVQVMQLQASANAWSQSRIVELENQLEESRKIHEEQLARKVVELEAALAEAQKKNLTLTRQLENIRGEKINEPSARMSIRPVKVTASTAPLIVRLNEIKQEGLTYEKLRKRVAGKTGLNVMERLGMMFSGALSPQEIELAAKNPPVFKQYHHLLYQAVVKASFREKRGEIRPRA